MRSVYNIWFKLEICAPTEEACMKKIDEWISNAHKGDAIVDDYRVLDTYDMNETS